MARWISIGGHPFVLSAISLLTIAIKKEGLAAGLWPAVVLLGVFLVPLGVFMVRQFRSGAWTTIDASRPVERPRFYGLALLLLAIVLAAVALSPSMGYLVRPTIGAFSLLIVAFLLNRWIKASLHVAVCGFSGLIALAVVHPLGVTYLLLLPLLAWARVRMARHTVLDTAVGAALGLVAGACVVLA